MAPLRRGLVAYAARLVWTPAGRWDELARPDALARVAHDGGEALVVVEGGAALAVENACPHAGVALTAGYRRDGWIECPMHGWRFDLATGRGLSHPDACLRTYPTRVTSGVIEVDLP